MNNKMNLLEELLNQEEELQFSRFTHDTAMEIGIKLYEAARSQGQSIAIDITLNGHCLFHLAMEGTSRDNAEWIRRKINTVNRFGRSSYYIGRHLAEQDTTIEEKYTISSSEYAAHGGAFPLRIRHVGVVGTITVSGLPQKEDHELVVDTVRAYLAERDNK